MNCTPSWDPLRPIRTNKVMACALSQGRGSTIHPLMTYSGRDHKAPRQFPSSIYLEDFNPDTALPLSKAQQQAEMEYLLPLIVKAVGKEKCSLQRDLLIGLARSCGRYLQDVSGSGNMCFTFSVMATAWGIYKGEEYPDFSNQREVLDAVGSSRGRMTAVVDAADAKLALDYGIPVCIIDNHALYGLSFYLTLPAEMKLSKGSKSVPLRDTECIAFNLRDFAKRVGSREEVVDALAKYAQQRRSPRTREGLEAMTYEDVARETLSNPWVLCIYHHGTHYQALVVKNPEASLRSYPDHFPTDKAALLTDVVRQKYLHNEA